MTTRPPLAQATKSMAATTPFAIRLNATSIGRQWRW
jgi:hypothetical protein